MNINIMDINKNEILAEFPGACSVEVMNNSLIIRHQDGIRVKISNAQYRIGAYISDWISIKEGSEIFEQDDFVILHLEEGDVYNIRLPDHGWKEGVSGLDPKKPFEVLNGHLILTFENLQIEIWSPYAGWSERVSEYSTHNRHAVGDLLLFSIQNDTGDKELYFGLPGKSGWQQFDTLDIERPVEAVQGGYIMHDGHDNYSFVVSSTSGLASQDAEKHPKKYFDYIDGCMVIYDAGGRVNVCTPDGVWTDWQMLDMENPFTRIANDSSKLLLRSASGTTSLFQHVLVSTGGDITQSVWEYTD